MSPDMAGKGVKCFLFWGMGEKRKKILHFIRLWGIIQTLNRNEAQIMKRKIHSLTETAIMLALLVILQAVTKSASQLVTGSCVNAVLAVSVLMSGFSSGLTVALVSPFAAFLLGIGPQLLPIVPAIALGNGIYVLLLNLLVGKKAGMMGKAFGLGASAIAKALALYLVVVKLLCSILPLKQPQIDKFSTMFAWPQLITALVGGAIALMIVPVIRKALHR